MHAVEFTRRIEEGIYDPEEYEKAYQWIRETFTQGDDFNAPEDQFPEKYCTVRNIDRKRIMPKTLEFLNVKK